MRFFISSIIAHRGVSARAPENTLAAFRLVPTLGLQWVEFDVMLAACGEAVVFHDETLERTTNGKGKVSDFPYSYLRTLDAGKGEKISTLAEVLTFLQSISLSANIEIKATTTNAKAIVDKVLRVVDECWQDDRSKLLISSFSSEVLSLVRESSPTCLLGFLMHEWRSEWQHECDQLKCVTVGINEKILTPDRIIEIKNTGRLLLTYTVDDKVRIQELFALGVDGIFSNCP